MDYTVPKLGVEVAYEELPTNCPASLAVFCYLRLAGVPFELSHEVHSSGIVPYVKYGMYTISDKDSLIERLIENDIINLDYDCKSRLGDIKKWTNSIKSLEKALKGDDTTTPQNYDEVHSGLGPLLGTKEFFYGVRPTSLDAYFIGHALFVLYGSPVASPVREYLRAQENLRAFVERFKANFLREETNWTLLQTPKRFEYYQLLYFSRNRKKLGDGSTGEVHSACIIGAADHSSSGMMVAIKWPNNIRSDREKEELERELKYLKVHRHENIIKLLGYIRRGDSIYLMYEYMEKTSANHNFHDLDWDRTFKIALGSAAAMEYLHTRVPALIFRDFKLGNILLDKDFNPKLSDFGAVTEEGAKLCAGTPGLTDVNLLTEGLGETAQDIYGMGTLLMNLLKQWVPSGGGEGTIDQIVRQEVKEGRYIVHQILRDSGCSTQKAALMYHLALSCVDDDEQTRPTIQEVILKLRQIELI